MPPCPVCGHTHTFPLFVAQDYNRRVTEDLFHYNKCNACCSLFLTNPPRDIEAYYRGDYATFVPNENQHFTDWLSSLVRRFKSAGTYFEIGTGQGHLIRAMKQAGYSVHGIEMSKNACEFLKQDEIEIINSSDILKALEPIEMQDCIVSTQVLEHLLNPIQVLKAAINKLKQDGILIISMPNPVSLESRWFRQYWYHLDAPRHQTLMTYNTFRKIAEAAGLEIVYTSWDDVYAQAWDTAARNGSMLHWLQATQKGRGTGLFDYLRFKIRNQLNKIIKHGGKIMIKVFRSVMGRQGSGNCYTVVCRRLTED